MEYVSYLTKKSREHFMTNKSTGVYSIHPKPIPENILKKVYTENRDYLKDKPGSIWGGPFPKTATIVRQFFRGVKTICDIGAGDGRHSALLCEMGDTVIALDVDESALLKNKRDNPTVAQLVVLNIYEAPTLPFREGEIDGIFSAGFLHLFSPDEYKQIAKKIDRVVMPNGKILIEFPINIKRLNLQTGKPLCRIGKVKPYIRKDVNKLIHEAFPNYQIEIENGDNVQRIFSEVNVPYTVTGNNLIVTGIKNHK